MRRTWRRNSATVNRPPSTSALRTTGWRLNASSAGPVVAHTKSGPRMPASQKSRSRSVTFSRISTSTVPSQPGTDQIGEWRTASLCCVLQVLNAFRHHGVYRVQNTSPRNCSVVAGRRARVCGTPMRNRQPSSSMLFPASVRTRGASSAGTQAQPEADALAEHVAAGRSRRAADGVQADGGVAVHPAVAFSLESAGDGAEQRVAVVRRHFSADDAEQNVQCPRHDPPSLHPTKSTVGSESPAESETDRSVGIDANHSRGTCLGRGSRATARC